MSKRAQLLLLLALIVPGMSCANKGKLKSPQQIQVEEAKKAKRAARENNGDTTTDDTSIPTVPPDDPSVPKATTPTPAPKPPSPADIPPSTVAAPAVLPGAQ